MSLDRVRQLLKSRAEVAQVAEVFGSQVVSAHHVNVHRLPRSCRGLSKTYAPAKHGKSSTSNVRAEVAEVFHSLNACAGARAHARGAQSGDKPLQPMQPMRAPLPGFVTVLKHCRCQDCRHFHCVAGEYYCTEHVGGTKVRWSDGYRQCDPPPDAWHYCALYHGPQISRDVWAWPKATPQAADVGAHSQDSREGDHNARTPTEADTGERGATTQNKDLCQSLAT